MSPIDGNNLDGKTPVKPTPFDAHEQIARGPIVASTENSPDKDPATIVEFPKAVDHVDHPSGVGQEPIVVKSAEEEKAYQEAQAAQAEAAPAEAQK
jgi:hypothetical protein